MYNWIDHTLVNLDTTWHYYSQLVESVSPTVDFLYNNVLTNPIFIWLILVTLILPLFTMWNND